MNEWLLRRTAHEFNIRIFGFVVPINNAIKYLNVLKKCN